MKLAWAIVSVFCARFLVAAWFYPGQDGDLAWQQWLGKFVLHAHRIPNHLGSETFTAAGAHWVPQEWAFAVAVASSFASGHFAVLALLTTAAAAGALLLTAYRSYRRGASTFAIALTTACTGFAMLQSFGVRAQVFGWLFLAVVMYLIDVESVWCYLAIPVIALWANVHASALIAPVFIGAWAFGTLIEDREWTPRVERNAVLTAGAVFAVFLTPFLWRLPKYAIALESSAIRKVITEWQPSDLGFVAFSAGVLPLLLICCYYGIAAPRERWRDGMLFAVSSVMAFLAVRHLPLAAVVIAPMAAARLTSSVPAHARVNVVLQERFSEILVFASTAVAAVFIALSLTHAPAIAGVSLPQKAMTAVSRLPGERNLYCEDFAWCSLALEKRNVRTFIDGRCDPFPPRVWTAYLEVERLEPAWASVLQHYRVNTVLAKRGRPLAQALAMDRQWQLTYRDKKYVVFSRAVQKMAAR